MRLVIFCFAIFMANATISQASNRKLAAVRIPSDKELMALQEAARQFFQGSRSELLESLETIEQIIAVRHKLELSSAKEEATLFSMVAASIPFSISGASVALDLSKLPGGVGFRWQMFLHKLGDDPRGADLQKHKAPTDICVFSEEECAFIKRLSFNQDQDLFLSLLWTRGLSIERSETLEQMEMRLRAELLLIKAKVNPDTVAMQ